MQNFNRSLILAISLFAICGPTLRAEQTGTNPKPKPQGQSATTQAVLTILTVLGM